MNFIKVASFKWRNKCPNYKYFDI